MIPAPHKGKVSVAQGGNLYIDKRLPTCFNHDSKMVPADRCRHSQLKKERR